MDDSHGLRAGLETAALIHHLRFNSVPAHAAMNDQEGRSRRNGKYGKPCRGGTGWDWR
jgi:hypothetical protein